MSTWTDRRYFSSDIQQQTIAKLIQKSILAAAETKKIEDDLIQLGDLSDSNLDLSEYIMARTYSNYTVWKIPLEPDNDRCRLWLHATNAAIFKDFSDFGGKGTMYGDIPPLNIGYDDGVIGNIPNPEFNGTSNFIMVPDSGNIQIKDIIATKTGISFFIRAFTTSTGLVSGSKIFLFSKIDDDLVTYAYQAFFDEHGIIYFEVIQNGTIYRQQTQDPIIVYRVKGYDYAFENFKTHDYYSSPVGFPPLTNDQLTDEFVFTYNFSTHAMQIYRNGLSLTLVSSTEPPVLPAPLSPPPVGDSIQLTISTLTASGGTNISYANDNNLTTRWEQASGSFPMWLLADMGQIKTILFVQIAWYGGAAGRVYNFELYVSDDNINWAKVYTGLGQGTDALQRYDFPDTTGRYVKLNITGCSAGTTASVYEFDIWGYDPITSNIPVTEIYNVPTTGGDYYELYSTASSQEQDPIFGVTGATSTDTQLKNDSGKSAVYNLSGAGSNGLPLSAAAPGGVVYNPTTTGASYVTFGQSGGNRAIGVTIGDSGSVLYGKAPSTVTFMLKRNGTFPTGTQLSVTGLVGGVGVGSSNSIDPNTVSTSSFTSYTFNISSWDASLHPLGVGSIIYLIPAAYTPGSAFIEALFCDPPTGGASDGTHTYAVVENSSAAWGTVGSGTSTDFAMTVSIPSVTAHHICAEYLNSTSSILYNKAITQATIKMKAQGAPTGAIYCRIRKAGGTTIAADASMSATSLTTSFVAYVFGFTNNTYAMQQNDQVEVQFDGGDPSVNYIWVQFDNTSSYDGTYSALKYQDTDNNWYADTASDVVGTMSINNAAPTCSVGEYVPDNTSVLWGKIITKATFKLAKVGPSVTGTIYAYVRLASGSYTQSPTSISASTLPVANGSNYLATDFDFSNNAHAMAVGDRVYIYYNSGDPSNYVVAQREVNSASGDSVHTIMTSQFPDGSFTQTTTDDSACTLYATFVIPATSVSRVAMYLQGDFSTLINHTPNDFTLYLKKLGAPTGTIYFRIRDINDAIVEELGTYNAASLGTVSNTTIHFVNIATFTHLLNKGDKISIEYSGGTSADRVRIQQNSKSYFSNPDTIEYRYSGTTWAIVNDRAISGSFKEGGQTVTQQWLDLYGSQEIIVPSYTHALYIGGCCELEQASQVWTLKQGFWKGVFSQFRIYYGILTAQEILNLYTNKRSISSINYGEILGTANIMKLET